MKRLHLLTLSTVALLLLGALSTAAANGRWRRQRSGTLAWLHAVYFLDAKRGWAAGSNGVLLSTVDGGENWKMGKRLTGDTLNDIFFSDERNGWMVCERSIYLLKAKDEPRSYLLKTNDGGSTWTRVDVVGSDVDARLVRVIFAGTGHGWAFGEAGVLYSTRDDGTTWRRQRAPTINLLLSGAFIDSEHGWIVGAAATILQTSDGGETWTRRAEAGLAGVRFAGVSYRDPSHGWVVGSGGTVYATLDGGQTWRPENSGISADLFDVKFLSVSEGWAIGKEGSIIHTLDGGTHWSAEQSSTTHPLERLCFPVQNQGWAVGFGGTILAYRNP